MFNFLGILSITLALLPHPGRHQQAPPTTQSPRPLSASAVSGIKTDGNFSVEELVQEIFVRGACKNIFNIKSSGNKAGIGYFENGESSIGIKSGIILATGPIGNAHGPNDERDFSGDFRDNLGDVDLQKITSIKVQDAVALEFDFIPLDSLVTFRYVFASEEYCEFVDSRYNDVFGFFVSGPGINGPFSNRSENIALIPNTKDFVSINNINHKTNPDFFVRNERQEDATRCNIPWTRPLNQDNIEYDGFTKVLTATLRLYPCQTYKLRLVIADVNDGNYDSAVFLEAESFNIGGAVNLSVGNSPTTLSDTIQEGCKGATFRVNRLDPTMTATPISIGLRVSPASSAVQGADFDSIPRQVTIPAGQLFTEVPIALRVDQQQENIESIVVELDFPCACIADTARIYIDDPPPLRSGLVTVGACLGDTATLEALPTGGVPGYTYQWSNGATQAAIQVYAPRDTLYRLIIKDACQRTLQDSVAVLRRVPPQAKLEGTREVCVGDSARVPIYFQGTAPFAIRYAINGQEQPPLENLLDNPHWLTIKQEGRITLTYYADAICTGLTLGSFTLRYYDLRAFATVKEVSCAGQADGQIALTVAGGVPPYQYFWQNNLQSQATLTQLSAGKYQVLISDRNACSIDLEVSLAEPPAIEPIAFDCREFTSDFISFSASGGVPPFRYSVNGGPWRDETVFQGLLPGSTHLVRIEDARGCSLSQDLIIPARFSQMVELSPSLLVELGQVAELEPKLNLPSSLIAQVRWQPSAGLSCTNCLMPQLRALKSQTYSLQVTDIFGCTGNASINVRLDRAAQIFVPSAFSPDGDGTNDLLVVFGNASQIKRIKSMVVFDRWGLELYRRHDFLPNETRVGWDGTYLGQPMQPGLYVYTTEVELIDDTTVPLRGTIQLVR